MGRRDCIGVRIPYLMEAQVTGRFINTIAFPYFSRFLQAPDAIIANVRDLRKAGEARCFDFSPPAGLKGESAAGDESGAIELGE